MNAIKKKIKKNLTKKRRRKIKVWRRIKDVVTTIPQADGVNDEDYFESFKKTSS